MSPDEILIAAAAEPVPVEIVEPSELEERLAALDPREARFVRASAFDGAAGSAVLIGGADGNLARVLFGTGRSDAARFDPLIVGKLPGLLPAGDFAFEGPLRDPYLAALAFALGSYRFTRYRTNRTPAARLVIPAGVDKDALLRTARATYLVRDLVNTPANDLGPADLAGFVRDLGRRFSGTVEEVVGDDLIAANFPLIHAVGRAAAAERAPRIIDASFGDPAHPKVTLVGKGVTFDTGGLDIKPSSGMITMKKDMGGAAHALALAGMILETGLKVRLRLIVPTVENAISGPAFRPSDVYRARSGLTVEIGNTDAEGRLILADALALAAEDPPELLIDLATLTGAARVALGPEVPPFYTHDDALAAELAVHAARVADPLWRMPLWGPYEAMLDSRVADINNAGTGGFAGSITAALFLARFVPKAVPWIHADIFAWNPSARPGRPEGGEAQTIRALYALIAARYGGD